MEEFVWWKKGGQTKRKSRNVRQIKEVSAEKRRKMLLCFLLAAICITVHKTSQRRGKERKARNFSILWCALLKIFKRRALFAIVFIEHHKKKLNEMNRKVQVRVRTCSIRQGKERGIEQLCPSPLSLKQSAELLAVNGNLLSIMSVTKRGGDVDGGWRLKVCF